MSLAAPLKTLFDALFGVNTSAHYEPTPLRAMREITEVSRFSAVLPYAAYHPAEGLFILDTGDRDKATKNRHSLGFALELVPQTGANEEMIRILTPVFANAPVGSNIQVSLFGSPRIIEQMKEAALLRPSGISNPDVVNDRRGDSIYRVMARRRVEFYLRGTRKRLIPHLPMLVRDYRVVFTLTLPADPQDQRAIDDLVRVRDGIQATLRAAMFESFCWTPTDLMTWCGQITNPTKLYTKEAQRTRVYEESRLIRHQIVDPDTICRPTEDGRSLRYGMPGAPDEMHSRLYTVSGYPADYLLPMMGNLIGDFYQNQLGYPCPFVITMGAHILDVATNKAIAQIRGARATTNATSPMARFMPLFQEQKRDWDIVNRSYSQGLGEVQMYHQVLLIATPDEIDAAENAARSIWRSRGFELVSQQYMQIPGVLASLPMAFTPAMHKFYKHTGLLSKKTTVNAVNMSPLVAEWKGTSTPVLQLIGRRGQIMSFDLFDSRTNYNFAVAAQSGSGKSVWANEIALGYLGVGAKVFIIDVGRSYEKVCRLIGGQFIEFVDTPEWQICINPFDNIINFNEDLEILKPLIGQMISPSGNLDDYERSLIEIALRDAWERYQREMTVTNVAEALKASDEPTARRLSQQLFPYTRDGMYGRYFEGKSNVDFAADFVVLELEELKSKKDLQSVVLFIMMYRITQCMYLENRQRKKICIIDEAWDLMGGGNSGKFIEEGYRRARKYGGAFGTLTQSIEDYYKNPASQAALDNSEWLFLLQQKSTSIEQLERSGKLKLDDGMKRMLTSVKTEKHLYSEIFINSPMGNGIGRLIVDPFSLLVYSSDPNDWTAIQRYRDQGFSVPDAINAVLRDRGQD